MRKCTYSSLFLALLLLLGACGSGGSENQEEAAYFPIKTWTEVQAENLDGFQVRKQVRVGSHEEILEDTLDAGGWLELFEVFLDADINTSSLAAAYETSRKDNVLRHELRPGEKGRVKWIEVRYLQNEVKEVSFSAETDNFFYQTSVSGRLIMHAARQHLDQFRISAEQKILFRAPTVLQVTGHVLPKADAVLPRLDP
ncbi:hypothetical protein A3SI_15021 [Nitritalea halalkaliphila LW7]|uniref:Lipoprotein n=1 Tax=Nitritalea halalkaliphila LW7 TaxID=1189621 RepID=I5BYV8_9BACT|nr:hypothetical protein [Nitritalea halalkaliphila]EIM74760.1 hypothetical protein A3SI_15021 [Nitritalea halalkaliphila LW7]